MTYSLQASALLRPPLKTPVLTATLGLLLVLVGIGGTAWTLAIPQRNAIEFRVPGETSIDVSGPTQMTLWNQNAPRPDIRAGEVTVLVQDSATGSEIPWQPRTNFSIGESARGRPAADVRHSLAEFSLPAAGSYRLSVGGTISPRMFAVTQDRGPWYVGPCILFSGGLLMMVGVVWAVIAGKPTRSE